MTDVDAKRSHSPLKEDFTKFPKKSRCIKTDKPRPFLCTICTRGFVRHEHLKRHQRSHTRERPFLCVLCGRCFARKDLVIRHQQKLHPSLLDESPLDSTLHSINYDQLNLNKLDHKFDKHQIQNGVLELTGNTETILPVGLGKVARKRSPRRNDTQISSIEQSQRHKRNASFSAASSLTYTKTPSTDLNDSNSTNSTNTTNSTHEVGFSTPQLTGEQLYSKAQQYGLLDQDPLHLPPVTQPTTTTTILQPHPIANTNNNIAPSKQNSTIQYTNSAFFNALPSLADIITLGTTKKPLATPSSLRINLDSFDYKLSNLPPPTSYPPPEQMLLSSASLNRPLRTPLSMFTTIGNNNNNNTNNTNPSRTNTRSNLNKVSTTNTNTAETPTEMDLSKDQWINKLLDDNMDNNNYKYNIQPENFNEIGFYPSNSSASSDISKDDDEDNVVQPAFKFPEHLTTGISEYFTSRQLDIFQVQSELLKSQENITNYNNNSNNESTISTISKPTSGNVTSESTISTISKPTSESKSPANNIMPNADDRTDSSRSNSSSDNNTSEEEGDDDDDDGSGALRINFKAKHNLASRSASLVSNTTSGGAPSVSNSPAVNFASKSHSNILAISSGTGLSVGNYILFTESIRDYIIQENKLDDRIFPTVTQLNDYVNLYELEFGRYFPFIHMPTLEPSNESYPLFTSMAMVGALYAFRSSHTKILSNVTNTELTKLLLQLQNSHIGDKSGLSPSVPTWILQTMLLINILGIFNNSGKVIKEMNTYMMSLIDLVIKYNVNLPLEQFMQPPIDNSIIPNDGFTQEQMDKSFKYFILAQERIRVCHILLLISNFFASLVGLQCCFHSIDLKCGVPTIHEDLFRCSNSVQWFQLLQRKGINIDSKFSLIQVANGGELYENCLLYLSNGDQFFFQNAKLSKLTLLSLMVSIHEKIYMERNNVISQLLNVNDTRNLTMPHIDQYWKLHHRPYIDMMIKYWEKLYIKNGGVLDINPITIPMIDQDPLMRAVLPLYIFSKIRKTLDISYAMNRIWLKDWSSMNILLDEISYDWDALRETTEYCLFMIDSWISIVSTIRKIPSRKFTEKSGYGTPISTITTLFVSTSVVAEYLKKLEIWAHNYNNNHLRSAVALNENDKMVYLKVHKALKRVQNVLLSSEGSMTLYLEFLKIQTKHRISTLDELDDENEIAFATSPSASSHQTADLIDKLNLSSRALYLGVKILGDSPVWPIIMVFAHALQSRAIFNVSSGQDVGK